MSLSNPNSGRPLIVGDKDAELLRGHSSGSFEHDALPHLNSVYNVARWLTRNDQDAEDIVQEVYLRALRSYHRFRGGDARPWLLKIARNTYYTWRNQNRSHPPTALNEEAETHDPHCASPEEALALKSGAVLLRRAIEALPARCREVLILRELEEMSYKEISSVAGVPIGTVMSRISRGRACLRQSLRD